MNVINKTAELSCVDLSACSEWEGWTGSNRCPNCGGAHIEVNNRIILTTYPAQSQLRCKYCGHHFSSGIFNRDTNDSINERLPSEQEPPSYPDIFIPRKDAPVGWICPKCGRSLAPHLNSCPFCNKAEPINITF